MSRPEPTGTTLLPAEKHERARVVLGHIVRYLARNARVDEASRAPGAGSAPRSRYFANDHAEWALFWTAVEQHQDAIEGQALDIDAAVQADDHLHRAMELAAQKPMLPTFLGGVFGIAWALEVIQRTRSASLAEYLAEDLNADIDAALAGMLQPEEVDGEVDGERDSGTNGAGAWEFDLFNGLAGLGIYALARSPRESGDVLLRRVVDRLYTTREVSSRGVTWFRPEASIPEDSRHLFPSGHYSLGTGHGTAGVVLLLARVHLQGLRDPDCAATCAELLAGAGKWLLSWRSGTDYPAFPAYLDRQTRPVPLPGMTPFGDASPLCWTNTDLGIAMAVAAAGLALGRREWAEIGIELAMSASRAAVAHAPCRVGFATGLAGVAQVMYRLWRATGDPRCLVEARRALDAVLDEYRPGARLAGFSATHIAPDMAPAGATLGVLEGIAGIGLVLLGAISPGLSLAWDDLLCLALCAG